MLQAHSTPERFWSKNTAIEILTLYTVYMLMTAAMIFAFYWWTADDVRESRERAAMLESQGR
jgi:hypothetical protein